MDIKCPSSKMAHLNKYTNLANLLGKDEVKFVIQDFEDFMFAVGVVRQYPTQACYIFSPCFSKDGTSNAKEIASWMMDNNVTNVRLGIQMHKIIGIY
jgi:7-carboxy-7-deazaguanine synthase